MLATEEAKRIEADINASFSKSISGDTSPLRDFDEKDGIEINLDVKFLEKNESTIKVDETNTNEKQYVLINSSNELNKSISETRPSIVVDLEPYVFDISDLLPSSRKSNASQQEIYLKNCKDLSIVPSCRVLENLDNSELSLKFMNLGPKGIQALADTIAFNNALITVDMTGNWFDEETSQAMCKFLTENSKNLSENNIGSSCMEAICQGLGNNNSLKTLVLKNCVHLANAMKKSSKLTILDVSHNNIGDIGAGLLASSLSNNDSLKEFHISWNKISKGCNAIFSAIKENSVLTHLHLSWNGLKDQGATSAGQMLSKNASLKHLNLGYSRIGNQGMIGLCKGISESDTLQELVLDGNDFEESGIQALMKSLPNCSSIQAIHLKKIRCLALHSEKLINELKGSKPGIEIVLGDT
ncbi:RNI-like protein [Rozella allomycis CSF55]|uniref:RNI-like protein n=1 Tax=Rozella allomycis (strain CSF55) TaxID=988480 RepID=A0A4P9YPQ4_ROZAC|nr:RNI-like protein [Rozella allomycis CSF55]RKP21766.1 RNI-like protein [Rozella allomycis CSF55]